MNNDSNKESMSTKDACELLGVSRQTLYKLCEQGEIPFIKVGSQYRFVKSSLNDYLGGKVEKSNEPKVWELRGDFSTSGIKKMAKRTFQEIASNIEELIANSYDADATLVNIILDHDKRTLSIIDDGNGMDEKALNSYVIYGESDKTSETRSLKYGRAPIGEYGMGGKLAITNICGVCRIVTRKNGKEHVFNMNRAELDRAKYVSDIRSKVVTNNCEATLHGTAIYMEQLSAKNIDADRLVERFSTKMPRSQSFKIIVITIQDGLRIEREVEEHLFEYNRKFDFEDSLKLVGPVKLTIYFTKEPIPATKQGIWTRVNGRIVNEKAEWFELFRLTSGTRYRYRLYGYGDADGLKNFVTFSKNDFVSSPEYSEYLDFGHKCISKVQSALLKEDENAKKELDRIIVKDVEKEINDVVSKLNEPDILGKLEAKIKKEFTKVIESAPENPYPDIDQVEKEAAHVANIVKRGKDRRERRNQSLGYDDKSTYSGKNYFLTTVDLSKTGDLVKFSKEKNLIEVNECHALYVAASRQGYLDSFVKNIAFTEIAIDYSDGNFVVFDQVYNELARISSVKIIQNENE